MNMKSSVGLTRAGMLVILVLFSAGAARTQEHDGGEARSEIVASTVPPDSLGLPAPHVAGLQWFDMFKNIPHDWARYSSITLTTEKIPAMIGMTAVTVALIVSDDVTWKVSDSWYRNSNVVHTASDIFEWFGDGRTQFGLAAGFAAYGFAAGDERALRTASQTTETILACGVVVQVLKHITGRESPKVSTQPGGAWRFFPNQIEYHRHVPHYDAYPSGHVATALATVIVIGENYPEITWIKPVGYTLTGLLAVAMVNTGIHWYSDYPLAIALGYSFGMLAAHPESIGVGPSGGEQGTRLSLAPRIDPRGGGGLEFRLSF
jgi:membrane-associated phospholipid phosphatase